MKKQAYTTVISFDPSEYDAHRQKIVGRGYSDFRTVYFPKGQSTGVAIPERQTFSINMSEVARIQSERDEMMIENAPIAARNWGLI